MSTNDPLKIECSTLNVLEITCYTVNPSGYWIDQDGNLVLDQDGNPILDQG